MRRMPKVERERLAALYPYPEGTERPRTRLDCSPGGMNEHRPCIWVTCRHNNYLDINEHTGSIKLNFPDLEPEQMIDSCSLDLAEQGGMPLEEVGAALHLTRERCRQLEEQSLSLIALDIAQLAIDSGIIPRPTDRRGIRKDCAVCGEEFAHDAYHPTAFCEDHRRNQFPQYPEAEPEDRDAMIKAARAAGQARGPAPGSMAYEQKESKR